MRHLTVFEHGLMPVASALRPDSLTMSEAADLLDLARRMGIKPVQDFARWESPSLLRFGRYVGVFALPDVQVEILPKTEAPGVEPQTPEAVGNADGVRLDLLRMLVGAGEVALSEAGLAAMARGTGPLLERIGELFVQELLRETSRGLPHAYVDFADDLTVLRGRLDIGRQVTRLAADPAHIACRYHEFTSDIPFNRILKCALERLRGILSTPRARASLLHALAILDGVASSPPTWAEIARIELGRNEKRFHLVFGLAKVILGGMVQDVRGGAERGFALLWDMPLLFERFIGARLMREEAARGRKIRLQAWTHLANAGGEVRAFHLRPDIVCVGSSGSVYVADTKWKRLDFTNIDLGVADADCYQLVAYAQALRGTSWPSLRLVYPTLGSGPVGLVRAFRIVNDGPVLEVHTVPLKDLLTQTTKQIFPDVWASPSSPDTVNVHARCRASKWAGLT